MGCAVWAIYLSILLYFVSDFGFVGIGEADWAFKNSFEVTEAELAAKNIDLVFEGLDTFSVIKLVRICIYLFTRELTDGASRCRMGTKYLSEHV